MKVGASRAALLAVAAALHTTEEKKMHRRFLAPCFLALALSAPAAMAQTPAPAAAAATDAVDPAAIQALKDMGTYLMALKRFEPRPS